MWTAVLFDADNSGYPYMKRFLMEATKRKQNYLGDNPASKQVLLTCEVYPLIKVTFGGNDAFREPWMVDAEQFIAVKGVKAKGKRISSWNIESIEELPPVRFPEPDDDTDNATADVNATDVNDADVTAADADADPDAGKSERRVRDEILGQLNLFPDDEI